MFSFLKVRKRLQDLEEQMLKLTRIVESHDLEWDDMRARCKRLLDRTEKAARALKPEVESEELTLTTGGGEGNGTNLTPAQAILQSKILSRRRLTQ